MTSTIALIEPPERINVAQDSDGFWTCREAIIGSQEYVRADIERHWRYEALRFKAELTDLLERCEKAEADSACVVKALVNETNRAEVAEARVKEWERVADKLQDQIHKYDALLDTAIRERDELRKALEPFIRLADEVFSDGKNENVTDGIIHWYFNDINITFGDLRRARASSDNHD